MNQISSPSSQSAPTLIQYGSQDTSATLFDSTSTTSDQISPQSTRELCHSISNNDQSFNNFVQGWKHLSYPLEVSQSHSRVVQLATSDSSPGDHQSNPKSPLSQRTERAAAHLLSLSQTEALSTTDNSPQESLLEVLPFEHPVIDHSFIDLYPDDGVFLPGSAYLDLHSTLRNHLIQEGRPGNSTRAATHNLVNDPLTCDSDLTRPFEPRVIDEEGTFALTEAQESLLWVNWLEEVAPWVSDPSALLCW